MVRVASLCTHHTAWPPVKKRYAAAKRRKEFCYTHHSRRWVPCGPQSPEGHGADDPQEEIQSEEVTSAMIGQESTDKVEEPATSMEEVVMTAFLLAIRTTVKVVVCEAVAAGLILGNALGGLADGGTLGSDGS